MSWRVLCVISHKSQHLQIEEKSNIGNFMWIYSKIRQKKLFEQILAKNMDVEASLVACNVSLMSQRNSEGQNFHSDTNWGQFFYLGHKYFDLDKRAGKIDLDNIWYIRVAKYIGPLKCHWDNFS